MTLLESRGWLARLDRCQQHISISIPKVSFKKVLLFFNPGLYDHIQLWENDNVLAFQKDLFDSDVLGP